MRRSIWMLAFCSSAHGLLATPVFAQGTHAQAAPSRADPADPCMSFFMALEAVPHVTLSVSAGTFESIWGEEPHHGCEIVFETNDSLRAGMTVPDFDALEDSELYRAGWRETPEIRADGPGSGIYAIERGSVACVVRWSQPAYIDDRGEHVQSDTLTITIQCRERRNSHARP